MGSRSSGGYKDDTTRRYARVHREHLRTLWGLPPRVLILRTAKRFHNCKGRARCREKR